MFQQLPNIRNYFPDLGAINRARYRVPEFLRHHVNRATDYLNSRPEQPYNPELVRGVLRFTPPQYMHRIQYNPAYTIGNVIGRGDPLYGTMSSIGSILGNDLGRAWASHGNDNLDYDTGNSGWVGSLLGGLGGAGLAHWMNKRQQANPPVGGPP